MTTLGHLINGARIDGAGRTQDIYTPSTGEVAGQVSLASQATAEDAIACDAMTAVGRRPRCPAAEPDPRFGCFPVPPCCGKRGDALDYARFHKTPNQVGSEGG